MTQELTLYVDIMPKGSIVMWYSKEEDPKIPPGWAICNGQGGTPDLRDRFIVGVGKSYKLEQPGGQDKVTLAKENLPLHTHTAEIQQGGEHDHELYLHYSSFKAISKDDSDARHALEPRFEKKKDHNDLCQYKDTKITASNFKEESPLNPIKKAEPHKHEIKVEDCGHNPPQPFGIIPPYYALYFIMKIT